MKKIIAAWFCLLVFAFLAACTQEAAQVEYYCTQCTQTLGEFTTQTDSTYDEQGRLTSMITYLDGTQSTARYLSYSDDGTTVTVTQQSNGVETSGQFQRTFDEKGNMLTEDAVEDGNVISSSVYTYDADGNVLSCIMTPSQGPKIITTYTYDDQGNRLSYEISYDYGGELGVTYSILREYEYDDQGHLTLEVVSSGAMPADRIEYTYDPETRTEYGTILDAEGNEYGQTRRIYDDAGNILLQEQVDANGEVQSTTIQIWQGSDGSISQLEE